MILDTASRALAELDLELSLPKRRRDLVLHHLHPHPVPNSHPIPIPQRLNTANVKTLGGIELQRTPTRLRLRRAVHNPTFSLIWFVSMHSVCVQFSAPASLRIASGIIRACPPTIE